MLTLNPHTTALVLIDLQKGILAFGQAPRSAEAVLRNAAVLAECFRQLGAPVFRVKVGFSEGQVDMVRSPTDTPAPLPAGGLPADWLDSPDLLPTHAADIPILKRQWNAFYGTELDLQLRRRGMRTVVLGGLVTPFGVESTARAGWESGYDMVFPEDLSSAPTPTLHEHSFKLILPRLGRVVTTQAVLGALGARA